MWLTITWLIIAVTVLIIVFKFQDQWKDILIAIARPGNKTKINFPGFNIDLSGGDPSLPIGQQDQTNLKQFVLLKAFQSNVVTIEEKSIRDHLIEANTTTEQAINVLINHLANSRLNITMLLINNFIYNEQIELLAFLNNQINSSPEAKLRPFFERWKERSKDSNYTFECFLNFLLQHRLVAQNIEGYSISILGKEYLAFLIKIGKPLSNEMLPEHNSNAVPNNQSTEEKKHNNEEKRNHVF